MQASNDLFWRERLCGKDPSLRYNAKAITFQENPEDDKWRKYLPIGLPSEVQYSV